MALADTLEILEPLGHTIIALDAPPTAGADTLAWIQFLDSVSDAIEQRPAIIVVPFADLDDAQTWAAQAPVETSYRVVCACYHGATDQLPQIAACVAAALADSNDPALPFNGYNLPGLTPAGDQHKKTFARYNAALAAGVCVIVDGADGVPEIMRAVSTYRKNPDTGADDDILMDINGALVLDYVRKVLRTALGKQPRRKHTVRQLRNVRSLALVELLKLDDAEILKNVRARQKELTIVSSTTAKDRGNLQVPADWVWGLHVIAPTLNVY